MDERGGLTGCGEGVEGLWAGEGEVRGSPGEREGAEEEEASGAGRAPEESGGEGFVAGVGLHAAGLVAAGLGLMAADPTVALPGLGAVGGPRGFGDTGGAGFASGPRGGERERCQFSDLKNSHSHIYVYIYTLPFKSLGSLRNDFIFQRKALFFQ